MLRKPPCPPNCERRITACQGSCPEYKEYRAQLDEDNRIIRESKENGRNWTEASTKANERSREFKRKLARGVVHK